MIDSILTEAKILIVDDERANVRFLEIVLHEAGYQNVFSTMDPLQAIPLCFDLRPDVLLLDLHMPGLDGFAILDILQSDPAFNAIPVLVLTADGTAKARHKALMTGAKDFLIKPLDEVEVKLRLHNVLEARLRSELLESSIRDVRRFMTSTFDALSSHIAVVDQNGKIVAANRAWHIFAEQNHGDLRLCGPGANYFEVCERSGGPDGVAAWEAARGIRSVVAGETKEFRSEYTCHSDSEERWFTVRATPFSGPGPALAVVVHENITGFKLAERELAEARGQAILHLAGAADYRDAAAALHSRRVGAVAGGIARALGLPEADAAVIEEAAPLHDVGRIAIPDAILRKPDTLTPEETLATKGHTQIGADLLSGSSAACHRIAGEIALHHHEHWNGAGYGGLSGEAIPLSARIVAVADLFDALTHARPFKAAWSIEEAVAEIRDQSGRHFDPAVVEAFLTLPHAELI